MKNQLFVCLTIFALAQAIPTRVRRDVDLFDAAKGLLDNVMSNMRTPQQALAESQEIGDNIAKLVTRGEDEISSIYAQIIGITQGEANLTKGFLQDFNKVKASLRISRQELRILAQDIVGYTNDITFMLDHEENLSEVEVEVVLDSVKELLGKSGEKLTKAKNEYLKAVEYLAAIGRTMNEKIDQLNELTDENSVKYKKYAKDVREVAYGGCATVTVGMIIADVMGCVGFCSATGTSTCWAAAIPTVETSLANYREVVTEFKQRTAEVRENINNLETTVQDAVSKLEHEIGILNNWEVHFDKLEKKQYKPNVLIVVNQERKELVSISYDLNRVANQFLGLSPSLFGNLPTNTQVNVVDNSPMDDPVEEESLTHNEEVNTEETNEETTPLPPNNGQYPEYD